MLACISGCGLYNYGPLGGDQGQDGGPNDGREAPTSGCSEVFGDDFEDGTIAAEWEDWQDGPETQLAESAGLLTFTTNAGDNGAVYAGYVTANDSMRGYASVEVIAPPNPATESQLLLTANDIRAEIIIESGRVYFRVSLDIPSDVSATYDAVAMRWLRIRWDMVQDTMAWQTSRDGTNWVTQRSGTPNAPPSNINLMAGIYSNNAEVSSASFDNFSTGTCPR